jgi:protein O-mannosyl-transferase
MTVNPPEDPDSRRHSADRQRSLLCLLLLGLAVLPFVTVWPKQFLNWDDVDLIVNNGAIQRLTPRNIAYLFTHEIGANYIPLTWLSHAIDLSVYGNDAWGHGLTSALWHGVCTVLLVACLRRGRLDLPAAGLTGALFAVHPVHVENVAWLSDRKDLLCAAALLACQFSYMGWRQERRRTAYAASLVWLVLASLCKPAAMSAVAVLWLYDVVWSQRTWGSAARSLWPHALVCLTVALVAAWAQHSGSAIARPTDDRWWAWDRVSLTLLIEISRAWCPLPDSPFLPMSILDVVPRAAAWLAPLLIVVLSAAIWRCASTRRGAAVAWWWFGTLAFLLPVCGVLPLGNTSLADRYVYLPSIGPCVVVATALVHSFRIPRPVRTMLATVVVISLAAITHLRAGNWSDSYTLWRAVLRPFPTTSLAWQNLTGAYYLDGEISQAVETALQGLEATHGDHDAAVNAISLLTTTDRLTEARKLLEATRKIRPESPELMLQSASIAMRQGEVQEARAVLRDAARLRPGWPQPHLDLSYAEERAGKLEAAIREVATAVSLEPKSAEAHRRLVELLIKSGEWERSLTAAERMTEVCPYSVDGWEMRIFILEKTGRHDDAGKVREQAKSVVKLSEGS